MRDTVLEQYLAKMGFLRDDYLSPIFIGKRNRNKAQRINQLLYFSVMANASSRLSMSNTNFA